MNIFSFIIIILCIITIILACLVKRKSENFEDLNYTCEAIQNKYYHPRELLYKAGCPNLVIVEKDSFGTPLFTAEAGDKNGPYFSKDYIRYYHLGVSPDGVVLDLEYDLYYRPWYNPIRWFGGPYGYYRPRRNRPRRWKKNRRWNFWDRKDRKDRQDRPDRQDRQDLRIKNSQSPNKKVNTKVQGKSAALW